MMPSIVDVMSALSMFATEFFQTILGQSQTNFQSAALSSENGAYDVVLKSYEGAGGLRYRVPLHDLPSERHCKQRIANIKILMDNIRRMSANDDLPSTPEEKKFWAQYRFVKYQVFLAPFSCILPPVYVMCKVFQTKIPAIWRGRTVPLTVSAALAEQWAEQTYPAHQLLSTALSQKTPLGDAARAEWQRLQPLNIPFHIYTAYQFQHFFGRPPAAAMFGGDMASYCNT